MSTWTENKDDVTTSHPYGQRGGGTSAGGPGASQPDEGEGRASAAAGRAAAGVSKVTGQAPGELAANLGEVVRRNAMPLALIGLGVAWLATSQTRGRHAHDDLEAVRTRAGDAGREAASRAGTAAERARSSAHYGREATAEKLRSGSERARGAADSASDLYHRNPLLVGMLAAGGAAAIAAAVTARRSDGQFTRYVQERATAAGRQVSETAREETQKAKKVAERAAEAARETAAEEAARENLAGKGGAAPSAGGASRSGATHGSGSGDRSG